MITSAFLSLFSMIFGWLSAALPSSSIPLYFADEMSEWVGKLGPLDVFFPVHEIFQFLGIFLGVWVPAAVVYRVTFWIYRHLPFFGKG